MRILSAILPYFQIIVSLALIVSILVQQRGAGLSEAFGGSSAAYYTKRGLEKILFIVTVILSFLFILISVLSILI